MVAGGGGLDLVIFFTRDPNLINKYFFCGGRRGLGGGGEGCGGGGLV